MNLIEVFYYIYDICSFWMIQNNLIYQILYCFKNLKLSQINIELKIKISGLIVYFCKENDIEINIKELIFIIEIYNYISLNINKNNSKIKSFNLKDYFIEYKNINLNIKFSSFLEFKKDLLNFELYLFKLNQFEDINIFNKLYNNYIDILNKFTC